MRKRILATLFVAAALTASAAQAQWVKGQVKSSPTTYSGGVAQ